MSSLVHASEVAFQMGKDHLLLPSGVDNTSDVLLWRSERAKLLHNNTLVATWGLMMRSSPGRKRLFGIYAVMGWSCLISGIFVGANAQEPWSKAACASTELAAATKTGAAGGASSSDEMGKRRPLYRLHQSDVLEVSFTFSPEFDQTVSVQPDGFISLKGLDDLYVTGMTLGELREKVCLAYLGMLHEPEVTVTLKDFEKPYFVASGQVVHPGKYELRGDATVTEALAIAGGFTEAAKHSEVVLFRRIPDERVEARLLNVKKMLNARDLTEDVHLRPGDMLFVPQNRISKIRKYLPVSTMSMYVSPTQF